MVIFTCVNIASDNHYQYIVSDYHYQQKKRKIMKKITLITDQAILISYCTKDLIG